MGLDLWELYRHMYRSRRFELAVKELWEAGAIPGEMHLSMGEEAIVAGILTQLEPGDAIALDHRGSAPMLMRGVEPKKLLDEICGLESGLCRGFGGHMHLLSREHDAASSGIVGACAPLAAGFAVAAQLLEPGKLAVAFFGDGAMNQGMLLESFNLAAAWNLPVLFVCKDDGWAITTRSSSVTGGKLVDRAAGFGLPGERVDGADVEAVYRAAARAIERARSGNGPSFLHATCVHLEGHFLGDPLLRVLRKPRAELGPLVRPLLGPTVRGGSPYTDRATALGALTFTLGRFAVTHFRPRRDPVRRLRGKLGRFTDRLEGLERDVDEQMDRLLQHTRAELEAR